MVLGNKKPDPSNSFQSTSYSFELQAPLPSLAMELDLALGFRLAELELWNLEFHRPSSASAFTTSLLFLRSRAHQTTPRSASVTPLTSGVGVQISCSNFEVELPSSLVAYGTRGQHREIVDVHERRSSIRDSVI